MARWRAQSDDFERIDLRKVASSEQLEVWALAAHGERIWAGTYGAGLLELDLSGGLLRQHQLPDALGGPHVIDLLATADGGLWVVSLERRLLRFELATGRFSGLRGAPGEAELVVNGMGLRGSEAWFSTRDGRVCTVAANLEARCDAIPLLAAPGRARMLLPGVRGDWVGGIGEILRSGADPQRIAFQPGSIGGVPQQALWTALADLDQGLWFGSSGGGLLHLPVDADRFQVWQPELVGTGGLRDGRVRGIARDAAGSVWIATLNAGLHRLQPGSGAIQAVSLPGTAQRRVWAVLAIGAELWVGHQDGLVRVHVDVSGQLRLRQAWSEQVLLGGMVDLLHRDKHGQIWAASMGAGLNRIDPDAGTVVQYAFSAGALAGTEVQQIVSGIDGRTWVATDRGLQAYDPECDCWESLVTDARVEALAFDADDQVYAFVDGQLLRYRWRHGLFRDASWAPRAFAQMQTVGDMIYVDAALWLAGPQGLYRYSPAADRIEAYDSRDGLATRELSDRPMHVDASGRLWIGSEDGLLSLDPHLHWPAPSPPALRFDSLNVDGSAGTRSLPAASSAVLLPDDRELRVVVRLASLARAHAQRFSFRVAGWERDWSEASGERPERCSDLPQGNYSAPGARLGWLWAGGCQHLELGLSRVATLVAQRWRLVGLWGDAAAVDHRL